MKKKKDNDKRYKVVWVCIIGIVVFMLLKQRSENPISPFVLIIGIIGVVFSGYLLWKLITEKNTDEQPYAKQKIKYTSIFLAVCMVMTLLGYCTMSIETPKFSEREEVITGVIFNGADEDSVPLSFSDLKLLKKGNTYTLLGTLKKTSTEPEQSYFKFDVAMIDKNGKHIIEDSVDTMPYPFLGRENMPLFTYESSCHLEKEIYTSSSAPKPVSIEITNIREYDKANFIQVTLDEAKEYIGKGYYNDAKRCIEKIFEYEPDNAEAKALLEQSTDPQNAPATSPSDETTQSEKDVLIGTSKGNVRRLLSQYKETKSIMSDNALDFENKDLLITVYFNSDDIADGVLFMQNSFDGVDTLTGVGSYVSKHYDELVKLATDDPNVKVESDLTLYNSQGVKKEAMEIYIGNIPNMSETSASSQNGHSEKTTESTTTSAPEFKEIVFLNVGLKVYKYKSDSSYIGTIKMVDREYKDERGKKVGAVYLEGGDVEGWYKREDIQRCFARTDDPFLNYSYE